MYERIAMKKHKTKGSLPQSHASSDSFTSPHSNIELILDVVYDHEEEFTDSSSSSSSSSSDVSSSDSDSDSSDSLL